MRPVPSSRMLAVVLIAVSVAGCSGSGKREADRNRYACDDGMSFSAEVSKGAEAIWVRLKSNSFRMDRVESDAGDRYVRGSNTLSLDDDGVATLALGDGARLVNCRRSSGKS